MAQAPGLLPFPQERGRHLPLPCQVSGGQCRHLFPSQTPGTPCWARTAALGFMLLDNRRGAPPVTVALGMVAAGIRDQDTTLSRFWSLGVSPCGRVLGVSRQGGWPLHTLLPVHREGCSWDCGCLSPRGPWDRSGQLLRPLSPGCGLAIAGPPPTARVASRTGW